MNILSKIGLLSTGIAVVGVTSVAIVAAAPNSHANAAATSQTTGQPTNPGSQTSTRLADAKLKACQNREKAINNILSRIADRGQKQEDLFTTIATRVETFYTNKGKALSNYDTLVADVTAKKAAAQTAVDTVKADSVTFKCDGTDPKGAVASFQDALKSEISALKDYRTAVKNLIVGVKSVQGSTTSDTNSQGGQQ